MLVLYRTLKAYLTEMLKSSQFIITLPLIFFGSKTEYNLERKNRYIVLTQVALQSINHNSDRQLFLISVIR